MVYKPKFVPTKMQFEDEQAAEHVVETHGLRSVSDAENSSVLAQANIAKAKVFGTLQNFLLS